MSAEFGKDHGLVHEAIVTGRKVGADENFWAALAHCEKLFRKVVVFVAEELVPVFTLAPAIDRDMTGWKCVEPAPVEEGKFGLVVHEFLREGETYLCGEEMVKRGKAQGANTGLRHFEAVLREQDKIPVELRKFCLVSTEIWLSPRGSRCVWSLYWDGERWLLYFYYLGDDFDCDYRLVGSRKYQKSMGV